MSEEEIMSEEAFNELIDNLEIIEKLTPYGRKAIKYWVNKLQKENKVLKTEKQLLEFQEKQLKNYIEELKKHDYRNIKIDEENKIKSPSFTKEQLDLMNLGIALYISIPKLLEDESEDIDI